MLLSGRYDDLNDLGVFTSEKKERALMRSKPSEVNVFMNRLGLGTKFRKALSFYHQSSLFSALGLALTQALSADTCEHPLDYGASKEASQAIKSGLLNISMFYAEYANSQGFRVSRKDFDLDAAVDHLINIPPPPPHFVDVFAKALESISPPPQNPEPLSFHQYVSDAKWAATGSANFGSLKAYFKPKLPFRARKNQLMWFLSPEEIIEGCDRLEKSTNAIFVKDEPGKNRLAVGGDVCTSIMMGYLYEAASDPVVQVPEIYERDTPEAISQLHALLDEAKKNNLLAMSYDFFEFDHQPPGEIVPITLDWLTKTALKVRPPSCHADILRIRMRAKWVWAHATYVWIDSQGVRHEVKVKDGLPSGIRLTSLLCSLFNWATHTDAKSVSGVQTIRCKGDDCLIIGTLEQLIVHKNYLDSKGVKAGNGKFGILGAQPHVQWSAEFLRRFYTPDGWGGYPARSSSTVFQRKPWNADDLMSRKAKVVESWITVCRRSGIVPSFGVDLSVPVSRGGPGAPVDCTPTKGVISDYTAKWLPFNYITVKPTRVNLTTHPKLLQLPPDIQARASEDIFNQTVSPLDGITEKVEVKPPKKVQYTVNYPRVDTLQPRADPLFASHKWLNAWWAAAAELHRYSRDQFPSAMASLRIQQPQVANKVCRLVRRGLRLGEAVDWVSGKIPGAPTPIIHPFLASDFLGSFSYHIRANYKKKCSVLFI